uniref:Uncharacterized protein n=1 Tax=Setaria digitata TaxID=48799 RepID=A0A915PKE7_9BILA
MDSTSLKCGLSCFPQHSKLASIPPIVTDDDDSGDDNDEDVDNDDDSDNKDDEDALWLEL